MLCSLLHQVFTYSAEEAAAAEAEAKKERKESGTAEQKA